MNILKNIAILAVLVFVTIYGLYFIYTGAHRTLYSSPDTVSTSDVLHNGGTNVSGNGTNVSNISPAPVDSVQQPSPSVSYAPYGSSVFHLGDVRTYQDFSVQPVQLLEDSRCPYNARCIWAGRVRLSVDVRIGGSLEHTILTLGEGTSTPHAHITLESVTPEKMAGSQTPPSQYVFGLLVEKR